MEEQRVGGCLIYKSGGGVTRLVARLLFSEGQNIIPLSA
jgi:hypothetical protein